MRIDFLTLFPDMFRAALGESIIARGVERGLLEFSFYQIRDYTENKQKKVDDYPYGGGPGLVLSYQPIAAAMEAIQQETGEKPYCIYMTPQGKVLDQKMAKRLSKIPHLAVLCGHYEGVDERVIEDFIDEEVSLGDFVLTGGEIPAIALADCVGRLIPGVLASEEATESESHSDGLLEYPQYTRPAEIAGKKVPEVLLAGNHQEIADWRLAQSEERTKVKRPDLYADYVERRDLQKVVYFDQSATTRPFPEVSREMERIHRVIYGNPSSLHHLGLVAEKELKRCRAILADSLRVSPQELYYTSGGTESNNWALRGYLEANPRSGKHLIVSAVEHPSVLETARYIEQQGYELSLLPVGKDGVVDLTRLENLLRPDTALVSVMHVNSETGAIQPIEEIHRILKRCNPQTVLHVDGVQSYGKLAVFPARLGADLLSLSAHKIHGPRGVGALYVRKGIRLAPLLQGGGQEGGLRSGTENLAAIAGFSLAAKRLMEEREERYAKVEAFRNRFVEGLTQDIRGARILTDPTVSSPYIINVSFPGLRAEVLLHSLEMRDLYVSVGSACSSHKKNRSHVLTAMGVSTACIDGAIRISLSGNNTMEEVERALEILQAEVKKLDRQRRRSNGKG